MPRAFGEALASCVRFMESCGFEGAITALLAEADAHPLCADVQGGARALVAGARVHGLEEHHGDGDEWGGLEEEASFASASDVPSRNGPRAETAALDAAGLGGSGAHKVRAHEHPPSQLGSPSGQSHDDAADANTGFVREPLDDEEAFYLSHVIDVPDDDDAFFSAEANANAAELARCRESACRLAKAAMAPAAKEHAGDAGGGMPASLHGHPVDDVEDALLDGALLDEALARPGANLSFASTSGNLSDAAAVAAFGEGGGAAVFGCGPDAADGAAAEEGARAGVGAADGAAAAPSGAAPAPPQTPRDDDTAARHAAVHHHTDLLRGYEVFDLRVIHRRKHTGFEEEKEFPIEMHSVIAGRYQILEFLGSAAFSRAVQAVDLETNRHVCIKIIRNNKDLNDQSLDEVKLLMHVNRADPGDAKGILRLYDFFYFKEHLFIVTELLRANLYEFQKYNRQMGEEPYFTMPRLQSIARQVLTSLEFMHSMGLIHNDLKPENILIQSYSQCRVKVIDLGSSCFTTDHLSSYVQSRSYRAPEVILGHFPYDQRIDIWSLGLILAELYTGKILLQNHSLASLLARLESIFGALPQDFLEKSKFKHRYYTRDLKTIFERDAESKRTYVLKPVRTTLRERMMSDINSASKDGPHPPLDDDFVAFLTFLLRPHPDERPSAKDALRHKWLSKAY